MKLTPMLRLVATVALVFVATAVVWWLVGFTLGKSILGEVGGLETFRRHYGYEERALAHLLALSLVVPLAQAVAAAAAGGTRVIAVAATAFGAALLFGDKAGGQVGVAVVVLGAAAVAEAQGSGWIGAALLSGAVAAFAFAVELPMAAGPKAVLVGLRAVFWFLPLLAAPDLAERWVLSRLKR